MDSVHHIWCPLSSQEYQDLPDGAETTLTIVVRINLVPIGEELHGDYVNDKNFKRGFQRWLNGLWEEKDRQLTDIMRDKER
ncbi:acyltransferase yihG [Klebsiella variicola]|nr:acyltransferase yihG [Klebsiella variicola]SAU82502.1 acyltransferase yihG [Klebsiella variicola]